MPDPDNEEDHLDGFARKFKERWGKVKDQPTKCPSCGASIPPNVSKCPKCKAPSPSSPSPFFLPNDDSLDFDVMLSEVTHKTKDGIRKKLWGRTPSKGTEKVDFKKGLLISEPLNKQTLSIMKDRMKRKRKEGPAKDILALTFDDRARRERKKEVIRDEEALKRKLVADMEEAIKKGSILEELEGALTSGSEAMDKVLLETRVRVLSELEGMDTTGEAAKVKLIKDSIRNGQVLDAENQLMDLKFSIRAKRAKELLLAHRAKDLADRISRSGRDVARDQVNRNTYERVKDDLTTIPETEHPLMRAKIVRALEENRPLEAEEDLLDLKLAMLAKKDRDGFQKERETRIENSMKQGIDAKLSAKPISKGEGVLAPPILEVVDEDHHGLPEPELVHDITDIEMERLPELVPEDIEMVQEVSSEDVEIKKHQVSEKVGEIEDLVPLEEAQAMPELSPEPVLPSPSIGPMRLPFPDMIADEIFPEMESLLEKSFGPNMDKDQAQSPLEVPVHGSEVGSLPELKTELEDFQEPGDIPISEAVEWSPVEPSQDMHEPEPAPEGSTIEGLPATSSELTPEQINAMDHLQEGFEKYNKGDIKEALRLYDESIFISPSFEAYWYKSKALVDLGMPRIALATLDVALQMDPEMTEALIYKAEILLDLGEFDKANQSAMKAMGACPDSPAVRSIVDRLMATIAGASSEVEGVVEPKAATSAEDVGALDDEILDMMPIDELAEIENLELRARPRSKVNGMTDTRGLVNGRGLTNGNGLVNGRGLTNGNGLVNGRGLVNGKGLMDGRSGLTNGQGLTNGTTAVSRVPAKIKRRRGIRNIVIAVLITFSVLALPIIGIIVQEEQGMSIDGNFQDWSDVRMFPDPSNDIRDQFDVQSSNPDIDLLKYAIIMRDGDLYIYAETSGTGQMLNGGGMGVDVLRIFLDTDDDSSTGYYINDLGADRLLEVYGWDNRVHSTTFFAFDGSRGNDDWNAWTREVGANAGVGPHALEAKIAKGALGPITKGGPHALFIMRDIEERQDRGDAIVSTKGGALIIDQRGDGRPILEIGTVDQTLLRIELKALGRSVDIERLGFEFKGTGTSDVDIVSLKVDDGDGVPGTNDMQIAIASSGPGTIEMIFPTPFKIDIGDDRTMFLTVDIPVSAQRFKTIGAEVQRSGISVTQGSVTVRGQQPARRYIGGVPTTIHIDGAFDDWDKVPGNSERTDEVERPGLELVDYKGASDPNSIYLFMEVDGGMLEGAIIPTEGKVRPVPSPPGPGTSPGPTPPPSVEIGADLAIIMLDSDSDPSTGYKVAGYPIGAEFKVQIQGKEGIILSSDLYSYTGGGYDAWTLVGSIPSANDPLRIEASVGLSRMGLSKGNSFSIYFFMTDWQGEHDGSDNLLLLADPTVVSENGSSYSSTDGGSTWTGNGQAPSLDFIAIASDPNDKLYGLMNTGMVYQSTDDGVTWTYVGNVGLGGNFTGMVTNSSGDAYAVAANGTVYKSTDSGGTWTKAGSVGGSSDIVGIAVDSKDNIYLINRTGEVYNSTDDGSSWSNLGDAGNFNNAVGMAVDGNDTLFVLRSTGEIYNSTDSGGNWTNAGDVGAVSGGVGIATDSSNDLYVLLDNGSLYASTNGGGNWSFDSDLGADTNYKSITINSTDEVFLLQRTGEVRTSGNDLGWSKKGTINDTDVRSMTLVSDDTLYAVSKTGKVYQSNDNGTTWSTVGDLNDDIRTITSVSNDSLYAVSKTGKVYQSNDNGTTWSSVGNMNDDIRTITSVSNDSLYAVSKTGKVYQSNDNGTTWSSVGNMNADIRSITAASNDTLYAVSKQGVVSRSVDNGTTWTNVTKIDETDVKDLVVNSQGFLYLVGKTGSVYEVDPGTRSVFKGDIEDPRYVGITYDYTTSGNGYIFMLDSLGEVFVSKDGGSSWKVSAIIDTGNNFRALAVNSSNNLFALRETGEVYRSSDNGTTWTKVGDTGKKDFRDIATNPSDDLFVIKKDGKVSRSTDGGATWTQVGKVGGGKEYLSLVSNSTGTLFSLKNNGEVFRSTDNGTTWTKVGDAGDNNFISMTVDPLNNNTLYALAVDGTVYQSTDGGSTWSKKSSPGSGVYVDIAVVLIPEFQDLIIPILGMLGLFIIFRSSSRRRQAKA